MIFTDMPINGMDIAIMGCSSITTTDKKRKGSIYRGVRKQKNESLHSDTFMKKIRMQNTKNSKKIDKKLYTCCELFVIMEQIKVSLHQ